MSSRRTSPLGSLELVSLYSLAIAQPLYDLLARYPTFLSAHALQQTELIWFLCIVSFVIPATLLLLIGALNKVAPALTEGLRWVLAALLIVLLSCVITPQVFTDTQPTAALLMTGLFGLAGVALVAKFAPIREGLRLAAIVALLFPVALLAQLPSGYLDLSPTNSTAAELPEANLSAAPNLVMLVFDELPLSALLDSNQKIRGDLFPNFSRLADESDWYAQASTVASRTRLAIPALLTGNEPDPTQEPNADDHPQNLFTILDDAYSLNVVESASSLCTDHRCRGEVNWSLTAQDSAVVYAHVVTPKLLATNLPPLTGQWSSFLSESSNIVYDERVMKFEKWLNRMDQTGDPGLHYLHSLLPHIPYTTLPTTHRLFRHGTTSGHVTHDQRDELSTEEWADVEARYFFRWQLQLVDRMIGKVVSRLENSGRYDKSLLVVTADHGMRLVPGMSRRQPFADNYIDIAAVPVFVKRPGQHAPRRIEHAFQTTDLLPVLLEEVGLNPLHYGLQKPNADRQLRVRRIRSHHEYIALPLALDLGSGLDWWPADEQVDANLVLPKIMEPCESAVEVTHPELYTHTHPEHFLAAHILVQDPDQQQSAMVVEFKGRLLKALPSAAGKWSAFAPPEDFSPGFNTLRVAGETNDGWCLLFDNSAAP